MLYTSIPHATLKEALKALIQEAYKVRGSEYIVADTNGNTYWSEVISTFSTKCNIYEKVLIVYVEYLIDNINVSIGNKVYRQFVGILIGIFFSFIMSIIT